jgi:hypothetical protein
VRDWINRLRAARWIKLGSPAMDDRAPARRLDNIINHED